MTIPPTLEEPLRTMLLVGSLSTGGAERFVANVATHLDRQRFKPYLALFRDTFSYPIPDDVQVKVLRKFRPWHNIRAALRLARWIDEVRPHVLLSAWSVPNVFAAESLRWTRHQPIWIARIANNPAARETGLYGQWARWSYKRADAYIAVCQGLADAFAKEYAFAANRISVVYNSVDPSILNERASVPFDLPPNNVVRLLAAGRLHGQKRYDVMLRALALARQQSNVHLHILGEGEESRSLRRLASELGVNDIVTWHGFQDNPYPYYAAADIFLLTSDYEGLSNALLEAQALGKPAVVTDCPFGNAEVVKQGQTGFIAPVGDFGAIARHLSALAANTDLRKRMSAAARERATKEFSISAMMRSVEQLISSSTDRSGTQPPSGLGTVSERPH
jgi:glycosyltransferase involved in cell wall biosynthesis